MFVLQQQLQEAVELLDKVKNGEALPGVTNQQLWHAQKIKQVRMFVLTILICFLAPQRRSYLFESPLCLNGQLIQHVFLMVISLLTSWHDKQLTELSASLAVAPLVLLYLTVICSVCTVLALLCVCLCMYACACVFVSKHACVFVY